MDSVENTVFSQTFATACQLQFHHRLDLQPSKPVQTCLQLPEVMGTENKSLTQYLRAAFVIWHYSRWT